MGELQILFIHTFNNIDKYGNFYLKPLNSEINRLFQAAT